MFSSKQATPEALKTKILDTKRVALKRLKSLREFVDHGAFSFCLCVCVCVCVGVWVCVCGCVGGV